jgi:N-acetylglucosaminyldiphosphoundecaprenol N-acetyl-beta-D-mannosaminyltransferase
VIAPVSGQPSVFLGLSMAQLSLHQAVDAILDATAAAAFSYVVTPNVDHVVRLDQMRRNDEDRERNNDTFAVAYANAGLVLCDSRILQQLARMSGLTLPLVPGSDLTRLLLADPRMIGCTVAIVGGSATLVASLETCIPGIRFTQLRPPMNVLRDAGAMAAIERFVAEQRADVVLFAMGAPQSEIAALRCQRAGRSRGIGLCIGASLEFIIGEKRRAPRWMQRIGMEWAFRLGSEPRRLWRRYLVEGPRIFAIWARQR